MKFVTVILKDKVKILITQNHRSIKANMIN